MLGGWVMPDSLDPVLLHIRKAYRLLNAYHQRILSTIPKIAERLDKVFLRWDAEEYYTGQKVNKAVFNHHLGLMSLQKAWFLFRPMGKLPMPGEWLLEVEHCGDSAFEAEEIYDPVSLP